MIRWRYDATANQNRDTRTEGFRVRELRQACGHSHARQTKEEKTANKAEAEQAKRLAFSLSASLAFSSLSLLPFSSESFPSEASASNLRAHDSEALRVGQFATVVAKRLFIKIPEQMERLDTDTGAVELPLYERPEILHRVGVDITVGVFHGMVDDLMPVIISQAIVRLQSVGKQRRTCHNVLSDVRVKFMLAPRRHSERANVAAALHHTQSDSFVRPTSASNNALSFRAVHVAGSATDETLIDFNLTAKLRGSLVLHSFTNSVEHEPRGLLRHADVLGDFATTDAVLAIGNHPHGHEPLFERDRGFVQHRAHLDRELLPAFGSAALPDSATRQEHRFPGSAVRALDPVRPSLPREILQRVVKIVEVNNRFSQCFRGIHEQSMP
jgi:hypothetical protein